MTSTGRTVVAIVALVMGVVLVALGTFARDSGSTTAGVGIIGPVLGYVFGDRNGEKRLAAALQILQSEHITSARRPASTRRRASATSPVPADVMPKAEPVEP